MTDRAVKHIVIQRPTGETVKDADGVEQPVLEDTDLWADIWERPTGNEVYKTNRVLSEKAGMNDWNDVPVHLVMTFVHAWNLKNEETGRDLLPDRTGYMAADGGDLAFLVGEIWKVVGPKLPKLL